jgi:hypothetical protein
VFSRRTNYSWLFVRASLILANCNFPLKTALGIHGSPRMVRILSFTLIILSFSLFAKEEMFDIEVFDRKISLPKSCLWQLKDTVEHKETAVFKCDKGFDHEVSIVIQPFVYEDIMYVKNAIEVTLNSEQKIGNITHFHIEASIDTSRGVSKNFIDAFCDPKYCLLTLGENGTIGQNILVQLKSIPNKKINQD